MFCVQIVSYDKKRQGDRYVRLGVYLVRKLFRLNFLSVLTKCKH